MEKHIKYHKRQAKMLKKFEMPDVPLMKVQDMYAEQLGYKNWLDLLRNEI